MTEDIKKQKSLRPFARGLTDEDRRLAQQLRTDMAIALMLQHGLGADAISHYLSNSRFVLLLSPDDVAHRIQEKGGLDAFIAQANPKDLPDEQRLNVSAYIKFGDEFLRGRKISSKKEGEISTLSETIIKLADLDNLFFEVKLDQEDFGLVNIGQNVKVDLDSYENFSFIGKVSHLPNFADSSGSTQEFIVEITVDPSENRPVLLGMTGEASIIVSQTETEVPVLQFDTIFTNVDEKYIWTVENGVTKKRIIQTGLEGDLYTEIKEDLTGVQIVIPTNNDIEIEEGKTPKWQSK